MGYFEMTAEKSLEKYRVVETLRRDNYWHVAYRLNIYIYIYIELISAQGINNT
jgi:hypothetical protein